MQTILRKMGNSTGIILPKALLGELGVASGQALEVKVERGRIVATPVKAERRAEWATAAQVIGAEADTEAEAWASFGNEGDDDLTW
jgi:antitoxin MazE